MSTLRFQPIFHSTELQNLVLPVEVRKPSFALVAATLTSETVEVKPGMYHVTATTPTGVELHNQVMVEDAPLYTVELRPDPADASPHESEEVQRYIVEQKAAPINSALESLGEEQHTLLLRVFQGDPLRQEAVLKPPAPAVEQQAPIAQGTGRLILLASRASMVQLLQPNTPPLNVILPVAPEGRCILLLSLQADGRFTADVQLENTMADTLLRYYAHGMIAQAGSLVSNNSPALISEDLLMGKFQDPIAAAVGAYTLLRLGELERLHGWTEHLANSCVWLPDSIAIRMEHLARLGQHEAAWESLQQLPNRGLPFFSDGLSFVVNRLSQYIALSKEERQESLSLRHEAVETLYQALRPFATFASNMKPVVTFTGLDPNRPDDKPLAADLATIDGLDCAPFIG